MADDPYNWLDKDAAERLLRGDPVGPRDGVGAHELEQLLDAAAALGAGSPGTAELPGEEAALAAFRRAHHGTGARPRNHATGERVPAARTTLSGGIAERTRLGRPFRRGFAVALTACAIGGVAVAAGTGILPTPFKGGADPEPASSVSAAETPGTLESKQPDGGTTGGASQSPNATPGGRTPGPTGGTTPGGGHGNGQRPGDGTQGGPGNENTGGGGSGDDGKHGPDDGDQKKLLALCHDYESGKRDSMDRDSLRRLEQAAGGADKVRSFCRKFLDSHQNGGGSGGSGGSGGDDGSSGGSGNGKGHGSSGGNGGGKSGGDSDDEGDPAASSLSSSAGTSSSPAPTPTSTPSDPSSLTPSPTPTGQV